MHWPFAPTHTTCRLYCFAAASGDVIFTFATSGEIKCTPLSLSVSSSQVVAFGSYDGQLYVLDEDTGALLAQAALGGSLFASPVLLPPGEAEDRDVARLVTVTNRGRVAQFRLARDSGSTSARMQLVEEWSREVGCAVFTTPAVVVLPSFPTPLLVLGGTDGAMVALDAGNRGATVWRTDLGRGPIFCPPLLVGSEEEGVVVGCADGSIVRLSGRCGARVWTTEAADVGCVEGESITGRPALLSETHVVVTTSKGRILALHAGTGEAVGSLQLGSQPQRLGSPVVREADGKAVVVVGSRDDGLYGVACSDMARAHEGAHNGGCHDVPQT